ncbi:MAG: trypsin-like serine protease [Actinobacteria bacterium]|nr:trypsin-like serine protease [Actinomycetota bacterium]
MGAVKKPLLLLVLFIAVFGATGAYAITYGEPDGNGHPSTGALVARSSPLKSYKIVCSGTLISKNVFLTASHCTAYLQSLGITDVGVSFDSTYTAGSSQVYPGGVMHTNPLYNQRTSDPEDIAVVTFQDSITDILPVDLPAAGLLDQLKKQKLLNGTRFTSVGYGDQEPANAPGGHVFLFTGERRVATGGFNSLTDVWLKLSGNPAHGDGGTCYGDSGGPQFIEGTNRQVSITITGDAVCKATNVDYRLDTPQARAFLGLYVLLP